jgi:hypothetical protein
MRKGLSARVPVSLSKAAQGRPQGDRPHAAETPRRAAAGTYRVASRTAVEQQTRCPVRLNKSLNILFQPEKTNQY